ncbi:hypothetical protein PCANB_000991 [Pneumocystis canis]|nr:hypothetical protein PCANB_000991 [Pneumocystis canis]
MKYEGTYNLEKEFVNTNNDLFEEKENKDEENSVFYKKEHQDRNSIQIKINNEQLYNEDMYLNPYHKNPNLSSDQMSSVLEKKYTKIWKKYAGKQQLPLKPKRMQFSIYDQHDPSIIMTMFDDIASVLNYRSLVIPKRKALIIVDNKTKVTEITYNKLASRAKKLAQIIKNKSKLNQRDRVILIYESSEIIDFIISLFGCFFAGVIAVPINNYKNFDELNEILISTQSHLILTSSSNLKRFRKELKNKHFKWPFDLELWETTNIGGFYKEKNHDVFPLLADNIAYIEYSYSPTEDLRGVVISHRTVMNQMTALSVIISTVPKNIKEDHDSKKDISKKQITTESNEIFITYLDMRQTVGLIFGVLFSIYSGNTTVWCPREAIVVPGLWANLITKYKATIILADYPGLKTVTFNYQNDPMMTRRFTRKYTTDFSNIRLCLIDCISVDAEFHEIFTNRWLKPLGNSRGQEIISPILCLPEHGGMIISMRDWINREEQMFADSSKKINIPIRNELIQVLLDKEALKVNKVIIHTEDKNSKNVFKNSDTIEIGSFWYPLVDATVAIVDPEMSIFCTPNVIGEIWVDSPSLSGGYWDSPHDTDAIFHAKAYIIDPESLKPIAFDQDFLRTGLLGCIINGRILVLGLYEDRLRQQIEWIENEQDVTQYRYHYVSHLIQTIMRKVPHVFDCSIFDISINNGYFPVVILELPASFISTNLSGQLNSSNYLLLNSVSEKCRELLLEVHNVKPYCIMIAASNTLPRVTKNGHKEISNILCRNKFELGILPCKYVKFLVKEAMFNLPISDDPIGGIWSKIATQKRQKLLYSEKKQYSIRDDRTLSVDDRALVNLLDFRSIVDIFQWRVTCQSNELALCVINSKGREDKKITWRELDFKIASVSDYLKFKVKLQSGDHVILMYSQSDDFLYSIHACFCLGIIVIPVPLLDIHRLSEDVPSFLSIISDFKVKSILVNNETYSIFKNKQVFQSIRHYASTMKIVLPDIINTSKSPKQTQGCAESGFLLDQDWINSKIPALIWLYWSPDRRYIAVELRHETIISCCKIQKETCQMSSSNPLLGCVQGTSGIEFLHLYILGFYIGVTTYFLPQKDFMINPTILFHSIAKYRVKDTCVTPEILEQVMEATQTKNVCLHELKNLMIPFNSRPQFDYCKLKERFPASALDLNSLNNIYYNVLNPMIATRSYMSIGPIYLYLNVKSLRQGIIEVVDVAQDPQALLLYDSGMVPVSTHVAIVNPETCELCSYGEYGEIWVLSDANMDSFYKSKDKTDLERVRGILADGNQNDIYVRTGDLGFLYNMQRPIGQDGLFVEVQSLFVLGSIGDTFEINGFLYFPIDIETSVERIHNSILPGGSAIFQAGGSVVILIEVDCDAHLPSIVPAIINTILRGYQLIVNIVVFIAKGDFPRSRFGEKQRGKILSLWLTKKLKILNKFIIHEQETSISRTLDI